MHQGDGEAVSCLLGIRGMLRFGKCETPLAELGPDKTGEAIYPDICVDTIIYKVRSGVSVFNSK